MEEFLYYRVMLPFMLSIVNACTSSVSAFLTSPYTSWFPVVVLAVFAVIAVLSVVYGLSPFVGRSDIRTWTRIKIYEVLLSIVLILIFASFSTVICTANPVPALVIGGLVPPQCSPTPGNPTVPQASNPSGVTPNNFYSLGICDMYTFNVFTSEANSYLYYALLISSLIPTLSFSLESNLVSGAPMGFSGLFTYSLGSKGLSILPANTVYKYSGPAIAFIYGMMILNQVQLVLLSASVLIFSIFMALGLIARTFGITRTFGGSMIAFALGIGLIYPLMVSMTYGFIDYGLNQVFPAAAKAGILLLPNSLIPQSPLEVAACIIDITLCPAAIGVNALSVYMGSVMTYLGLIIIGLVFVPLLNFIIVDTFIIDFSQAIGERMDFLSMLTGILR